jgi:demethylmenaquinone methyltransferase / 2-methoxy-6-polyprenyl-1,4-benzoquinol methylase
MSETSFGFRTVTPEEKTSLVRGVFDSVAARYDLMNDAMSLGMHRLWKRDFVGSVDIRAGMRCLDVAGGTGDIAFRLLERGAEQVTVCDINHTMLAEGQKRADDHNRLRGLEFVCGNAESLPFPDHNFHLYTIAFGIRNVTYIEAALREAHRVLLPGGRFMCLEFSKVHSEMLAKAYDAYSFHVIPRLGGALANDKDSYQYLVESIRKFPSQDDFAAMIRAAGFEQVRYTNMSGGVVAMHSGYKI